MSKIGQRSTRQRHAILTVLKTVGRPLSPKEILEYASVKVPKIGIATVYRNVRILVDEGVLDAVHIPGQPPRYQFPHEGDLHLFIDEKKDEVHLIEPDLSAVDLSLPKEYRPKRVQVICYGEIRGSSLRQSKSESRAPRVANN